DRRLLFAAARLATPAKVEARQREPRRRQRVAEQQVLVGVLRGGEPVTRDHARDAARCLGRVQDERELAGGQRDRVPLGAHAQARWNSRQAFVDSWNIASSIGSRLSLATSSATRAASHGPDCSPANSPSYCHGASLSPRSDSSATARWSSRSRSTSARSRSRYTTSGVTETK